MCAVEAATDAEAARALLQGFVSAGEAPSLRGGNLRFGDVSEAAVRALAEGWERGTVRPVGTEQSNTSLRLDRTLVFKLFRKLDEGENPELEVGRFLTTRTTFRAMPRLCGSLTYISSGGESSTVGVLQEWIENRGDGWSYVVAALRHQQDGSSRVVLLRDLVELGVTTADFHTSLAVDATAPPFAPEPATAGDVEAWQRALLERISRTFAIVERSLKLWPEDARRLGDELLGLRSRAAALAQIRDRDAMSPGFQKIRVHGDYHLGQTLKTDDGFVLIDFEGEPARPLAERRSKHSALKDVAGMIRSFDYALEAAGQQGTPNATRGAPLAKSLRESFLEGYLSPATRHGAAFLPRDRRAIDAWIDFFELEKALYELEYEINSRPAWVHIPLRGILRILDGHV